MRTSKAAAVLAAILVGFLLLACASTGRDQGKAAKEAKAVAVTRTATVEGRDGKFQVEASFEGRRIASVRILGQAETAGVGDEAVKVLPDRIVRGQSLAVDAVAGASVTSQAIIDGVADCLRQAGLNPDDYQVAAASPAPAAKDLTMETQVVVAGGGISGLMAAISAADHGAKVILVEKRSITGGSAALSSAFMVTVGNSHFPKDIDGSMETTMAYLMSVAKKSSSPFPDQDLLRSALSETSGTVDYLLGLGLKAKFIWKNAAVVAWEGEGAGLMQNLARIAKEKGVTVLLECPAKEILMENGKAAGLKATYKGDNLTIRAQKVILATGGAAWDQQRVLAKMPQLKGMNIKEDAATGSTGDGFAMMEAVKAQFYDDLVLMGLGVAADQKVLAAAKTRPSTADHLGFNAEGKRYMAEAQLTSAMLTIDMVKNGSKAFYWLFDASNPALNATLDQGVAAGQAFRGASIEELAGKLRIDPAVLKATYERYQALAKQGSDADFGKASKYMVPYAESAGFYALAYYPWSIGTLGGVVTDKLGRAYGSDHKIIGNLFAVGEMSNRAFYSDYYIGGCSMSLYSTMGRLAGTEAAAELK